MLSCEKNRNLLSAYLDKELSEQEICMVERHLSDCEPCRTFLNDMKKIESLLNRLEVPPVPLDLSSRILSEARERKQMTAYEMERYSRYLQFWKNLSPAAAALVLGLGTGAFMGWTSFWNYTSKTPSALKAEKETCEERLYALDILSPVPFGSIEAATLALMENGE